MCGKCDRQCNCSDPDCKPEHATSGARFEGCEFDPRLRPALWAGAERIGLHLPALEANRRVHRPKLTMCRGGRAHNPVGPVLCQLQPWLERLMAQPKTIPQATYAKILRKDDWPDQSA